MHVAYAQISVYMLCPHAFLYIFSHAHKQASVKRAKICKFDHRGLFRAPRQSPHSDLLNTLSLSLSHTFPLFSFSVIRHSNLLTRQDELWLRADSATVSAVHDGRNTYLTALQLLGPAQKAAWFPNLQVRCRHTRPRPRLLPLPLRGSTHSALNSPQ